MIELVKDIWDAGDYIQLSEYMKEISDEKCRKFNQKIIPDTVAQYGIKVPVLRNMAKKIAKGNYRSFVKGFAGEKYEDILLLGLVLSYAKSDYDTMLSDMKFYAQKISNWALCDTVVFYGVEKHLDRFYGDVLYFIYSQNPWLVRYGLTYLMRYYLDSVHIKDVLMRTYLAQNDFYYVKMMRGWLFATAFAKCPNECYEFFSHNRLDEETAKITISKARDSFRINKEDKKKIKELLAY